MSVGKKTKLRGGFNLGGETAEADPLLKDAFFSSGQYEALSRLDDPHSFIIGRTGTGKSACLQQLEIDKAEHVIRINPEDLSLPYITDLQVVKFLQALDVHLDPLWIALWKHVLLVEIIRHRYKVTSPVNKATVLDQLRRLVSRDTAKAAALDYLNDFEGKFWCETDERVREITDNFTKKITVAGSASGKLPGLVASDFNAAYAREQSGDVKAQLAERFQRIVNETQLARLNMMIKVLDEDILPSKQDYVYVVIDDLDSQWVDDEIANDLIRCLFRTVLQLKRVSNLKVLVALRTNILEDLDFGQKSGQEEKIRAQMLEMRWSRAELKDMLAQRVPVAATRHELDIESISKLLPHTNRTRGSALDYIIDRTLLRPRDAIAYLNECLAIAAGKSRLAWKDITNAESAYSKNRLLALRDEWKGNYPGIEDVVMQFRGAPPRMTRDDLNSVLEKIALLPADPSFSGVVWVTELSSSVWLYDVSWEEMYHPILRLLYRLGFLGCSGKSSSKPTFYSDDEMALDSETGLAKCEYFYVHRTYQAALEM
ncbi:P-loop ATPase, Sll1717 family [Euzebya rosea]|uniref:P-loop ATPase, Sll1717 family n=1 Tax=Euzebya rosea TaxID=2052804 RepID=UPI0013005F7A|nr:hypothetical protein [Euzebya rosea]